MYSIVLTMVLAGAGEAPQGILFNRGGCSGQQAGGCAGAGLFSRGQRHGLLYRLRHRSGGCGGNSAQAYGGCSGGVSVAVRAPGGYFHYRDVGNGYRRLSDRPDPNVVVKYPAGTHVNHPARGPAFEAPFPAGTGVVVSYTTYPDGREGYRVRCDATGKILPAVFKESELTPVP